MIRIALAADQALVRQALAALLREHGFQVVGQSAVRSAHGVTALCRELRPDLLVIDLGEEGSFSALGRVRRSAPRTRILALLSDSDLERAREALDRGAQGVLSMGEPAEALLAAVRELMRGGTRPALLPGRSPLTPRERRVLTMIARGMTNAAIARELGVSVKTVETHRAHLLSKLGARGTADLTRFALARGWVRPER